MNQDVHKISIDDIDVECVHEVQASLNRPGYSSPGYGVPGNSGARPPGVGGNPGVRPPGHGVPGNPGVMPPGYGLPGNPGVRPPENIPGAMPPPGLRPGTRPIHAPPGRFPVGGGRLRPDPIAFSRLRGRNVYVRLINGRELWFIPVVIGRTVVAGYEWRMGGWRYTGFSISSIAYFMVL